MRAQVVLTPPESKCLIAKAIARMDMVQKAAASGTIVIHASSTSYFLVKELTGEAPWTDHWVHGGVFPQGLCTEVGSMRKPTAPPPPPDPNAPPKKFNADWFPFKWVIKDHKMNSGIQLGKILEEMEPSDVYVKGCNAVDAEFHAGVLFGHDGGGTIARVMGAQAQKGFNVVLAVGLEKFIPGTILQAAKTTAQADQMEYAMGMPCGLYPVKPSAAVRTVTEIQAIDILSGGAKAVPVAAGGLAGAEGAVVLVIEGNKAQIDKIVGIVEECKGAHLPQVRPAPCNMCGSPDCKFPVKNKHWYARWA
ncbi:MAG TPA: hypothetical protein VMB24_05840 [Dehalococcoidales bacterium]|nr:hypothetical protein [Dehalococcoidales bacterium]